MCIIFLNVFQLNPRKITTKDHNGSMVDIVSHLLVVERRAPGYYTQKLLTVKKPKSLIAFFSASECALYLIY